MFLLLAQVAILNGIMAHATATGNGDTYVGIIHICLWAVLLISFEIIYQIFLRKEVPFGKISNVMDMDEFNKRVTNGE